jgi:hypothetical protein
VDRFDPTGSRAAGSRPALGPRVARTACDAPGGGVADPRRGPDLGVCVRGRDRRRNARGSSGGRTLRWCRRAPDHRIRPGRDPVGDRAALLRRRVRRRYATSLASPSCSIERSDAWA